MGKAEDELYELLKDAEMAETNEDQRVPETTKFRGFEEAEQDPTPEPEKHTDLVMREVRKNRDEFLRRLFDHPPTDRKQERPAMSLLDRVRNVTGRA